MGAEGYGGPEQAGGGSGGDLTAYYWLGKADLANLPNGRDLSALANGSIIKVSVAGGVASPAAAVAGVDYVAPGGVALGQTIKGGAAASETLTLSSTAHATKGKVYLGSAQTSAYDEVNDRLGVGIAVPTSTLHVKNNGAVPAVQADCSSATQEADVRVNSSAGRHADLFAFGDSAGGTLFGASRNGMVGVSAQSANFLAIGTIDNSDVLFGANNTEAFRIDQASKQIKVAAAGIAANGTGTVTVGNLGPGTAALTIQSWWEILDSAGNLRKIPLFG